MADARSKIWLVDSRGLVCASRLEGGGKLEHHKLHYAHPAPAGFDASKTTALIDIVRALKPSALIGVSAQPQIYTKEVVRAMCEWNESPIIFALSNPTSKAECTATQAYAWSNGRAVFASGSPFDPVTLAFTPGDDKATVVPDSELAAPLEGASPLAAAGGAAAAVSAIAAGATTRTLVPGQANNSWIFPAVGLAVEAVKLSKVTDHTMWVAAKALAESVTSADLSTGCLFPPLSTIRDVSAVIAAAIAEDAYTRGEALLSPKPADLLAHVKSCMWSPYA